LQPTWSMTDGKIAACPFSKQTERGNAKGDNTESWNPGILWNPWNPMESYGILESWNPGILWNPEILWNPVESYGILWNPMESWNPEILESC
jgi:hypothetical protein